MSPTPRAAAVLAAIALAAPAIGTSAAVLAALALAAVLVADALAARRAPDARRTLAATLARRRPVGLEVTVRGGETGRTRIRQAAVPGLDVVPREGDGGLDAAVRPAVRGRHVLPPATARVRGPLGLVTWDHAVGDPAEVRVLPDVPGARRLAHTARTGRLRDPGTRPRGQLGLGTDFEQVRDYLPDDDIRHVNWRATARAGRPMTNVYRIEQEREIQVLLDTGRLMAAPVGDGTRLDVALDAAAAIAYVADELGDRCGVVAYADTLRRVLPPRRRGGDALVQACFDLDALPVESDPELAFQHVAGRKRSLVLVLTDVVDASAARSLLLAVPVLARRHAVIVASVTDPDLEQQLDTPPRTQAEASLAAVAATVTSAQREVVVRLRGAGAQVVDAAPEHLPARVVAAYLRAKATSRA